ncbi:hypothetical protein RQP46_002129 [Phenoliferia psychrophenolica]
MGALGMALLRKGLRLGPRKGMDLLELVYASTSVHSPPRHLDLVVASFHMGLPVLYLTAFLVASAPRQQLERRYFAFVGAWWIFFWVPPIWFASYQLWQCQQAVLLWFPSDGCLFNQGVERAVHISKRVVFCGECFSVEQHRWRILVRGVWNDYASSLVVFGVVEQCPWSLERWIFLRVVKLVRERTHLRRLVLEGNPGDRQRRSSVGIRSLRLLVRRVPGTFSPIRVEYWRISSSSAESSTAVWSSEAGTTPGAGRQPDLGIQLVVAGSQLFWRRIGLCAPPPWPRLELPERRTPYRLLFVGDWRVLKHSLLGSPIRVIERGPCVELPGIELPEWQWRSFRLASSYPAGSGSSSAPSASSSGSIEHSSSPIGGGSDESSTGVPLQGTGTGVPTSALPSGSLTAPAGGSKWSSIWSGMGSSSPSVESASAPALSSPVSGTGSVPSGGIGHHGHSSKHTISFGGSTGTLPASSAPTGGVSSGSPSAVLPSGTSAALVGSSSLASSASASAPIASSTPAAGVPGKPAPHWSCSGSGNDGHHVDHKGHGAPKGTPTGWQYFGNGFQWGPGAGWTPEGSGHNFTLPAYFQPHVGTWPWWSPPATWTPPSTITTIPFWWPQYKGSCPRVCAA